MFLLEQVTFPFAVNVIRPPDTMATLDIDLGRSFTGVL
jgi:hypothetical protein